MAFQQQERPHLPPRPQSATASRYKSHITSSPFALSPRTAKHVAPIAIQPSSSSSPSASPRASTPRRPLSASSENPHARMSTVSPIRPRPSSATMRRPVLSLQAGDQQLYAPVDTISYTSPRLDMKKSAMTMQANAPHRWTKTEPISMDESAIAHLTAFLTSWQTEEPHFRSSMLFSESTFAQARGELLFSLDLHLPIGSQKRCLLCAAMVANWPHPNTFLTSIAFGCMEQLGLSLEKQYPFLMDILR